MTSPSPSPSGDSVWIALALLLGLFVGTWAGALGWLSGQAVATAVLTGGTAFAGTVTLATLIKSALDHS
jgi:hypothetical protein